MNINDNVFENYANGAVGEVERINNILIKNAIFIRDKGCLKKILFSNIIYLKGDGNYTNLLTRDKAYSLRNILKEFEGLLPEELFIRIHKSFIVNLNEINTISPKEITVLNEKVPVGRTYYQNLINGIQKLGSNGVD